MGLCVSASVFGIYPEGGLAVDTVCSGHWVE